MFTNRWKSGLMRFVCGTTILAGGLLMIGAPRANASDNCQRKLAHADHELDRAIEKHGYNSRQADHKRHELREAREWCWEHRHRWWMNMSVAGMNSATGMTAIMIVTGTRA